MYFFLFLFFSFFAHIHKNVKCLSGKYYKENKERLQKKLVKDIKTFLIKKTFL